MRLICWVFPAPSARCVLASMPTSPCWRRSPAATSCVTTRRPKWLRTVCCSRNFACAQARAMTQSLRFCHKRSQRSHARQIHVERRFMPLADSDSSSDAKAGSGQGVGARLLRKEDDRFMRGRGQYVADIRLAGLQDVAFVRSPLAHARITAIHVPERYRDVVFTAADLVGVKPIRAVSGLPGFKISEQPVLATGKVRHVGELVAMCVAPTRAEAEDIAASVVLDLEELPAVYDMLKAREAGTALVHEHWGDNIFLESAFEVDMARAFDSPIKVPREISTARQCMSPLEGRGVVAAFDHRLDQLTLYTGAQMPHIVRNGLSDCLGIEQGQIRIVSPDIGGGFCHKGILLPGEIFLARLAVRKSLAVRRIEDPREHLTASAKLRAHYYKNTPSAHPDPPPS